MPEGAKVSRRKQLQQVEKQLGTKLPELESSRNWHGALLYLWQWYVEVSINTPLTYQEIQAWSNLTRKNVTSFEVDVLLRLDYLNRTNTK